MDTMINSVDSDEIPLNMTSHQGLLYLLKFKKTKTIKNRNEAQLQ